jgi:hypothetical protein
VRLAGQFVYPAVALDSSRRLWSNRPHRAKGVGCTLADHLEASLTIEAPQHGLGSPQPSAWPDPSLGPGVQYACAHSDWLSALPLFHSDEHSVYAHAAVDSELAIEQQFERTTIWARNPRNPDVGWRDKHHLEHFSVELNRRAFLWRFFDARDQLAPRSRPLRLGLLSQLFGVAAQCGVLAKKAALRRPVVKFGQKTIRRRGGAPAPLPNFVAPRNRDQRSPTTASPKWQAQEQR